MSEYLSPSGAAASAGPRTTAGIPPSVSRLADHWGLVLGYGIATILLGFMLAIWPETSLKVLAILLGVLRRGRHASGRRCRRRGLVQGLDRIDRGIPDDLADQILEELVGRGSAG